MYAWTLWSGGTALWFLLSLCGFQYPSPSGGILAFIEVADRVIFLVSPLVRHASRGRGDSSSSPGTGRPLLIYSVQVSGHFNVSAIDYHYYCSPSIWMQMRLTPGVEQRQGESVCVLNVAVWPTPVLLSNPQLIESHGSKTRTMQQIYFFNYRKFSLRWHFHVI